MSIIDWSIVVANIVIVLTGLGAAVAWAWAVYTWYHTTREVARRVNGQLDQAVELLRRIYQDQALLVRPSLLPPNPPASVLGPIDRGPPH
jgi:hypothetical protein